jgi:hypothetical protein
MRKLMFMVLMAAATMASAQQLDLKVLDSIARKATSATEIGMDESTLKSTSASLNDKKVDEGLAKKTAEGLKGFFLRSYEFKKGDFNVNDIKPLMDQLKAPNWKLFLRNKEENEWVEIWWHVTNGEADGMILVAAENNELTVINALGISKPEDLAKLKDFGVPTVNNIPGVKQ